MADLKELSNALQDMDIEGVKRLTAQAIADGISPQQILSEGLLAGMDIVGVKFKNNELFIPEVLMVAKAMHAGLDVLKPKLVESGAKPLGKVVIGTVLGDLHDIGKNMVKMMLQGAGFDVYDLGIDVPPKKFVEAAIAEGAQIVGMSALLTSTMVNMKSVIDSLHEAGLAKKVKTLIGGAPVTQKFADEIGADGFGADAASAVDKARGLLAQVQAA
jgi:5-methyltetrahydrofolate--homocysteine methyltransferase